MDPDAHVRIRACGRKYRRYSRRNTRRQSLGTPTPIGRERMERECGGLRPDNHRVQPANQTGSSALANQNYATQTLPYTQNTPVMDSQGTIEMSNGNTYDFNALAAELSNPA